MIEEVRSYYDSAVVYEWNRLNNPYSVVEFNSTMHLINKYFPKTGAILDIGSGPGRYSLSLLKMGYKVSLLDISQKELDYARNVIEEQGLKAEAYYCKSALELQQLKPNKYDALLVMGPLYHLHSREERIKVLKDSLEILSEGGTAIISYINTWGVLRASVSEFPHSFADNEHFDRYIKGNLSFSSEESFTATFFTIPPLALEEVREAGFEIISYAGAESFLSGLNLQMKNLKESLPEVYENYMKAAADFCEEPQYRDSTEHLHIIVRKL
jgi:2-polyprenyl-3-methyl-5-hydroxy-6-metoxy-1,4-benzoquinol methylase